MQRCVIQVRQEQYRPKHKHEKLSSSLSSHYWQITKKRCKKVAGDNQVQTNERLLTKYSVYYTVNDTYHFCIVVVYRLSLEVFSVYDCVIAVFF